MSPRTPLALRNLIHQRARSLVGIAGVLVSLLLMLMQLGFFAALMRTATMVLEPLEFQVAILSPSYLNFYATGTFPRIRLTQAKSVAGVADAEPLYLGVQLWRCPPTKKNPRSRRRAILVIGFRLPVTADETFPIAIPNLAEFADQLGHPEAIAFDLESRPEFGRPGDWDEWELGPHRVEIVGTYHLGTGFGADGDVLVSDQTFARVFPGQHLDKVNIGLVTLSEGVDAKDVVAGLRAELPRDVLVIAREDLLQQEKRFWRRNTSVGILFFFGVVVAFCVGAGVVYQVLASDIADHQAEYATLKAIGYGNRYLSKVVLTQAVLFSLAGYVPALFVARGLFAYTQAKANVPMELTLPLAGTVLLLSIAMCAISGLLAVRKVKTADPASLF